MNRLITLTLNTVLLLFLAIGLNACDKATCSGTEEIVCSIHDEPLPDPKIPREDSCTYQGEHCMGCTDVSQYRGIYHPCVDKNGNASTDCSPACYLQKCTLYKYVAEPPCPDRKTISLCQSSCGYHLERAVQACSDCDQGAEI